MTAAKKFLFDLDFEVPEQPVVEEEAVEEEIEPEEEIPTFSEEEMAMAREEGLAEGREAGIKEAAETTERRIQDTLQAMQGRVTELFQIQKDANAQTAHDAIRIAAAVTAKALPDLNRRNALGEVEHLVEQALATVIDQGQMTVHVNPELLESLKERITALVAGSGLEDRVSVAGDAAMPAGDCRIDWGDGGAQRDFAAITREIDAIFEANLGPAPASAAPEKPAPEKSDETVVTNAVGEAGNPDEQTAGDG